MNFRATHDGRRNGIELRPCGRDRMVLIGGQMGGLGRLDGWGMTMSRRTVSRITATSICRVIAAVGCGSALAACSLSMPSFDMFKSGPSTEVLRIESEPPGADARTSQGQTCRTPCELTVPTDNELAVTVQMTGYQPQTMPVRVDGKGGDSRLQPNPVYVELQPAAPVKPWQIARVSLLTRMLMVGRILDAGGPLVTSRRTDRPSSRRRRGEATAGRIVACSRPSTDLRTPPRRRSSLRWSRQTRSPQNGRD